MRRSDAYSPWRAAVTAVAAFVGLLLLIHAADGADEPSVEDCLSCHGTAGFADDRGRALFVDGERFATSTHGAFTCTTCHTDATEIPHADGLQAVSLATCGTCHADTVDTYRGSVHGRAREQGFVEAATCRDCHGDLHVATSHTEEASMGHWSHLAAACARCHANVELAKKFRIPVVRPVEAYLESAHARAVARGVRAAVCSDCHGSHGILNDMDPRSSIWRANVPDTCGTCHGEILQAFRDSVHGEALTRGVHEAPVCTDCHGEHNILSRAQPSSPVFTANIPAETCGRCHGDARLSAKYGLPVEQFSTFQDSFHGLALRAGQLAVANCASCHGVHDIRPSSDPRSHVSPVNLAATCGKCHPGAGTRFALGPVHVVAKSSKTRIVYWVQLLYLWVIALVIGSMTLHNAGDLARKARHPPYRLADAPATRTERMPRLVRWQHGLVMLSFPVLVYTGFALTYPESWWAAPLLRWESRFGLRGLIHRVAASVLLVSLAWHVAHVVVSPRLRACMRGLWWSWADLRHFGAMVAFYTGLRPRRPHGGAFTYVEKAEYWAFMWGMLIMAATGFLLWFSNFTLEYLPKGVTDVATAIHFYEAVLATLAILVWHLYWVIFDPDVYPVDWSWWDGHAPAARELERQPEEGDGST